ncbi:MAG: TolC family protein [Chitinispirillaceae bacterium]|jgi:outer membrane protein TolC
MENIPKIISSLVILLAVVHAQEKLTADEAVAIALKNNYDIMIAHNDAEVARINNTAGNAGMLPYAAISASDNYTPDGNVDQKLSSGASTTSSAVNANAANAAAVLSWTLFDGGKMFVTKSKLSELEDLGQIAFKDKVLQTVFNVTVAYYDVVRQKQQLASVSKVLTYNRERVTILSASFGQGLSPKTDFLQAQIDLNVYIEDSVDQQNVIGVAKRTLNQLLSRDAETAFDVVDSIPFNFTLNRDTLLQKVRANNTTLLSSQKQLNVAKLSEKEFYSLLWPRVTVNGGYAFSRNDNPASSVTMNRAYGPQIGGTVSLPLYQGGNAVRQIRAAKLETRSAEYTLADVKLQVEIQVQNTFDEFENQRNLLALEKQDVALAKENLDISMQRLRYGQATSLELRQAEDSYEQSLTRLTDIAFNLKLAETKLKQLIAEL